MRRVQDLPVSAIVLLAQVAYNCDRFEHLLAVVQHEAGQLIAWGELARLLALLPLRILDDLVVKLLIAVVQHHADVDAEAMVSEV